MKQRRQKSAPLYFILPSLLGVLVFLLIPFLDVVRRTFTTPVGGNFVGGKNYQSVFGNDAFQLAWYNTMRFVLVCLPLLLVISLAIAVVIYSVIDRAGLFKTIFLTPMAIPVASVVLLWQVLFSGNGLINGVIVKLGGAPTDWMNTPSAFWVLVGSFLWKNCGYSIILWIAGLADISSSLYESAKIDGAGTVAIFFNITLPGLRPCFYTVTVLSMINIFKVFREAWMVSGDYPHRSIYLLQHLFNNWFRDLSIDKLSVAAVLLSTVVMLVLFTLRKVLDGDG